MKKEVKEKLFQLWRISFVALLLATVIRGVIFLFKYAIEEIHDKEIEEIRMESEGGLLVGVFSEPTIYCLFGLYGLGVFTFSKALLQDVFVYRKLKLLKIPLDENKYIRTPPDKDECPLNVFWLIKNEYDYYMDSTCFPDIFTALLMSLKKKGVIEFIFNKNDISNTGLNIKLNDIQDVELSLGEEQTYKYLQAIYTEHDVLTPEIIKWCMSRNRWQANKLRENYRKAGWIELMKRKYYVGNPSELNLLRSGNWYYFFMLFEMGITALLVGSATSSALQLALFAIMWNGFLLECLFHDVICYTAERLSVDGQKKRNEWLAFGKYLKAYSMLDKRNIDEVELWEDYLMFATVMGIANETTKKMNLDTSDTNIKIGNYNITYAVSEKEKEEYIQKYVDAYKAAVMSNNNTSTIQNFKKSIYAKNELEKLNKN